MLPDQETFGRNLQGATLAPPSEAAACASSPAILSPETETCSGRGALAPPPCTDVEFESVAVTAACACNDPSLWTGHGDLVFSAPTCALNVPAIQVLYGLLGVIGSLALACTLLYLRRLVRLHQQKGRKFSRVSASLAAGGVLSSVSFAILGFYRVARPSAAIGSDAFATALLGLGALGFTVMHIAYDCSLFALGFSHAGLVQDAWFRTRLRVYCASHTAVALLLIVCLQSLLIGTKQVFDVVVPLFLVGHAVLTLSVGALYVSVAPSVTRNMRQRAGDRAKSDGPLKTVLAQIDELTRSARFSCCFVITVSVLFAAWEGLRQVAYPYLFATVWVLSQVWQVQCMLALLRVSGFASAQVTRGAGARDESDYTTPIERMMNEPTRSLVNTEQQEAVATSHEFASNHKLGHSLALSVPASSTQLNLVMD